MYTKLILYDRIVIRVKINLYNLWNTAFVYLINVFYLFIGDVSIDDLIYKWKLKSQGMNFDICVSCQLAAIESFIEECLQMNKKCVFTF